MNKYALYKIGCLLVIITITMATCYGTQEHFYNSMSGKHFADDSSLTVQDDKYGTPLWSTIQKNVKVIDIITLQLNEDTTLFLIGKHSCKVDLEITYYDSAGHADSITTTLSIKYDSTKSKRFNFRSSFKFNGGYKVKARILSVFYDGSFGAFPKAAFTLAGDIYITRIYNFDCSTVQIPTHSFDNINQRLVISWSPVIGADEYDLEFTSYDDSSVVTKNASVTMYPDLSLLFNGNATRVTVQDISYAISLVYNPGYVLYRVRPIHYDVSGNRIEGIWSSEILSSKLSSFGNKYQWAGHENKMNWQYTAAYAEQGKRKEVSSYFDGSLRNRQSVTLNNTQNKALIGETIYDFQGRPAVTTLPAPIDSGKIIYYDKFNLDPMDSEYNRKDFDTGSCEYIPVDMDSIRGSSRYYSSSNPDTTSGFDRFLPDAQGYPFTMTEYTPDNTGRISRQSIAGKTHRFGSEHETKYYYGKPAQIELDRLFGNEVGDYSHYLENMVIDANGQISVSYIDENGKTIATALAGQLPSNVKPINSYTSPISLTVNILDSASNIHQNTSILSNYTLVATNSGRYYFTYKLFPGNYTDATCGTAPCTDCLYDVQLIITDDCDDNPLILHYDSNLTYTHIFDTTCGHQNIVDTFSVLLSPGSYNISRLITVDPKAISFYTAQDEKKNLCLKTYSTFLANAIANTNFSGCNMTCAGCLSALGSDTAFLRKYITELHKAGEVRSTHADTINADTAYNQALAQCNTLCAATYNPCASLYDAMLADVTLGGQYCTYKLVGSEYKPADSVSVLRTYTSPASLPYLNAAGKPDSVVINNQKFPPQDLTLTQFVLNWIPSWATSFVANHPEYCYYTRCISDTASNRYDYNMESITDFATACSQGYLAPLGYYLPGSGCNTTKPDPYFQAGGNGVSHFNDIKHKLDKYLTFNAGSGTVTLSMWATASLMEHCDADTLANMSMSTCYSAADTSMSAGSCAGNNNMEWNYFKSLYKAIKDSIHNRIDSISVASCNSFANCVGWPSCSGYSDKAPRHVSMDDLSKQNIGPKTKNIASEKRYADSALAVSCDSICLGYAYSWYEQLYDSCINYSLQSDSTRLIQGLVALCQAGCNTNHPMGASTTPNYIPDVYGDRDVEDVLVRVLGVSRANIKCDSLAITMPPTYVDSMGVAGAPVSYTIPSNCICNKLDTLLNRYYKPDSLSGDHTYVNFADYLNKNFGGTLSNSDAYGLLALCNSGCTFAPNPINIPLWLTCCSDTTLFHKYTNAVSGWDTIVGLSQGCCIKCSDIDAGMRVFTQMTPSGTDTLANYPDLLTNFLNGLFGFNLTYHQYLDYYNKCEETHCTTTVTTFTLAVWPFKGERTDSTCGGTNIIDTLYNYPLPTNTWTLISHHTGTLGWTVTSSHYNKIVGTDTTIVYVVDSTRGGITIIDTSYNNNRHNINLLNKRSYSNGPCTWTVENITVPGSNIPQLVIDSNCGGDIIIDTFCCSVTSSSQWVLQSRTILGTIISSVVSHSNTTGIVHSYNAQFSDTTYSGGMFTIDTLIQNPINSRWYMYNRCAHGLTPFDSARTVINWNIVIGANTYQAMRTDTVFQSNTALSHVYAVDTFGKYTFSLTWTLCHRKVTPVVPPCVVTITWFPIPGSTLHGKRIDSNCDGENIIDTLYNSLADTGNYVLNSRYWNDGYGAYTWSAKMITLSGPQKVDYKALVVDSVLPNGTTVIDTFYNYNPGDTLWVVHNRKVTGAKHDSLAFTLCNEPLSQFPVSQNIHLDTNTCYTYLMMDAGYNAKNEYNNYLDSVTNAFQAAYITHCMNIDDSFRMVMPFQEYHYTLYYYDQAGNLVKTIPPQGVHPITNATLLADITNYRAGTYGTPTYPTDSLMTHYFYNTLNSPSKQQTPDGDSVHYWYDALGRIVLSQNALQRPAFYHYDYTLYDDLNRITEVGEVSTVPQNLPSCFKCNSCIIKYGVLPVLPDTFARKEAEVVHFINMGTKTQIVHTYYDTVTYKSIPLSQQNLRKRISTITYKKNNTNPDSGINYYNSALHYSYDIEGNVSTLLLDVPGDSLVHQRYKRLDYYYDLVSGKVNQLIYQHDSIDQFIHVYTYDADNRITDVETSMDSLYWENDASYEYYDHGPLAREVIGQRQVQGIDYAYTLNGWIKGVNSSLGSYKVHMWPNYDMGEDGYGHGANKTIGRDAYGYVLNYFTGDYRSIAKTYFTGSGLPATSLYNGNISGATYAIRNLSPAVIGYTYGYDQLNRIVSTLAFKGIDTTNNTWPPADSIKDFREKVSYDENGNILTYLRHGNTAVGPLAMDSLNYRYNTNTNQLREVNDAVPSTNYTVDIDNETSKHNYRYNAIGELASDSIAGIDTIMWTIYHKVHKIVKTNNDSIVFVYDPLGNRLLEKYFLHTGTSDTTKYVRDAQGNIMAIYDRKKDTVRLTEWDIYGNRRLGSLDTLLRMQKPVSGHGTIDSLTISYLERQKQYELTNHLGNVLVTVSDGKTPVDTLVTHDTVSYYLPIVINAQDYYPYGMIQPGRSYTLGNDSSYKYAFNGMMKDNNIYGNADAYTTTFRGFDPRLSRWWSTDPKGKPEESPYLGYSGNPILYNDPTGADVDPEKSVKINPQGNIDMPPPTMGLKTNFYDKKGNLLKHVNDGSNAKFQLTGAFGNEYLKFSGYENQGGKDLVNADVVNSVYDYSQSYVRTNYTSKLVPYIDAKTKQPLTDKNGNTKTHWETYCNFGTRFIGLSVASALDAGGMAHFDPSIFNGTPSDMLKAFTNAKLTPINVDDAMKAAINGAYVMGGTSSHVFTLITGTGFVNNVGSPHTTNGSPFSPAQTGIGMQMFNEASYFIFYQPAGTKK